MIEMIGCAVVSVGFVIFASSVLYTLIMGD